MWVAAGDGAAAFVCMHMNTDTYVAIAKYTAVPEWKSSRLSAGGVADWRQMAVCERLGLWSLNYTTAVARGGGSFTA